MFDPIVVPLDGSLLAERALVPAKTLAHANHTQLCLVRVAPQEPVFALADSGLGVFYPDQELAAAWQETNRYLSTVQKSCESANLSVVTEVREGDAASEIIAAAHEITARLIIMSSHGYSGVDRWLRGSVAEKVLHAARCPVWVVRKLTPPQHVLVTLDGSGLAEDVLAPAVEVARGFGALVTLLRVVPDLEKDDVTSLESCEHGLSRRLADQMLSEANDYLIRTAERFKDVPVQIQTAVRLGAAAETILDFSERHGVDLVAMTTHGRTGVRRWIYGSVTQKVLDQAPLSMLVARSHSADVA